MWLFHFHSTVKIQPFSLVSPWRDPGLRHVAGYPFGASRKNASTVFYDTTMNNRPFDVIGGICCAGVSEGFPCGGRLGGVLFRLYHKMFMSSFVPERDKQLPQTRGLPTGKLK